MSFEPDFHGPNIGYIVELYERYLEAPDSVDAATQQIFSQWSPPQTVNGTAVIEDTGAAVSVRTVLGAASYLQAIRQYGHLQAQLDPLGHEPPGDPELSPEAHGITQDDLRDIPAELVIDGPVRERVQTAYEAVEELKSIYASTIGFDNDHIRLPEERQWLREAAESRRYRFDGSSEAASALLDRLTQIEVFEHFLQRSFPTKYRFSIEGLDMMVPMVDEIINSSAHTGIRNVAIAMAHRGRLNVLAHVMNKPYEKILADFKDPLHLQEIQDAIGWTTGDVKYHKGVQRTVSGDKDELMVTMPPNPSHLEAVNPVAAGMARAAGTKVDQPGEPEFNPALTMQILIHGDASFPGQGIVAETFNLSRLPGYWTGGTIHFIANNQLGFTTNPIDSRSTLYASDLAKGFKVPILHVNADDPAACIEVARIAFAFQDHFEKDVVIDLIGYRRYGHNELDEPGFTQPLMYDEIRQHATVRTLWSDRLQSQDQVSGEQAQAMVDRYNDIMQTAHDHETPDEDLMDPQPAAPPPGVARQTETGIPADKLNQINTALADTLKDFEFYSRRLENTIRSRREALDKPDEPTIDWATAEELAFASILAEGTAMRLTGQDSERGTFSHRHAVLHHKETGAKLVPLQRFELAQAGFEIHNSPLSEEAVLGFEFGYNAQAPDRLVIWEAQYGDFANGAQNIIDEFVLSAREKWGLTPSLVMLLPHGHEGAGPDHSSGRPERFLQSAAKVNMRLAYPTTAAQYFHMLRRQASLLKTDPLPLVVLTPKSLLRNPAVYSRVEDLTSSKWQPLINDADADPERVTRLVFCSGKFYYDLVNSEHREKHPEVALVRVEQLYPFAVKDIKAIIDGYPKVEQIVWAQEEPKNMGAWDFMNYRIKKLVGIGLPVNYVGRRRSSSPAEGSRTAHNVNQSMIVEYAFTWKFNK